MKSSISLYILIIGSILDYKDTEKFLNKKEQLIYNKKLIIKMITDFQLFEKYANNTIKYYAILIKKIYDEIKNESNQITYDFGINENDVDFKINNCLIIIKKSKNDSGLFTPSLANDIDNNTISDCEIKINYTKEENIIEIASHELQHCYEYIKLNNKLKTLNDIPEIRKTISFKINKSYLNISGDTIKTINKEFDKFLYVVKNTFNSEFNARITQLYGCLLNFEPDEVILNEELLKSKTMMIYNDIKKYANTNIYNRLMTDLGEENLLNITNKFNYFLLENNIDETNGYEFIKKLNKEDLNIYYNRWTKLFKHKNNSHYKKILNIVSDVIKRKNDIYRDAIKEDITHEQFNKWLKKDELRNLRIKKFERILKQ